MYLGFFAWVILWSIEILISACAIRARTRTEMIGTPQVIPFIRHESVEAPQLILPYLENLPFLLCAKHMYSTTFTIIDVFLVTFYINNWKRYSNCVVIFYNHCRKEWLPFLWHGSCIFLECLPSSCSCKTPQIIRSKLKHRAG